ncbi:MAG: hypothetical protein JWO38_5995 [Gemmataceae bacterium]|nr:hypothetical protein [Gemmataceae bacterium]
MTLRNSPHDPWVRLAAGVWVVLALMAVGRAAFAHHPRHAGCYAVFAQAGRDWVAGRDLYDAGQPDSLVVFRYAPTVAALLAPLGLVPDVIGNGLLRLANLGVFTAGLWQWQRVAFPDTFTPRRRAVFFLLVAAVGNNYLMDVQVNVLTAGLLLMTAAGAITGRWWVAAASIGLAVALKAYPVSLALVLCLMAPRQFAWRWAVAQAGWFALPFLLQDPGYVARQYRDWVEYGLNQRFVDGWFRDAMYLAGQLGWPMTRVAYFRVELVAAGVVGAVCWAHRRRPWAAAVNTAYGLCVGWMLAFGPATETVTYILVAPAVAGAVVLAWARPHPVWCRAVLGAATLLLAGTQLELLFPGPHRLQLAGANPAAVLLFLVVIGVRGFGADPRGRRGPAGRVVSPPTGFPAARPELANEGRAAVSGGPSTPAAHQEARPGGM